MGILEIVLKFGILGVLAFTLWLSHRERCEFRKDRKEERESFVETIQNHQEHVTNAVQAQVIATQDMKGALTSLKDVIGLWLRKNGN